MKIIAAKLTAREGCIEELAEACGGMLDPSRAEPGCISYSFYMSVEKYGEILFFEEWKDQAAIDFHFATDHFQAFGPAIESYLASEPDIKIYDVAGEPVKA
ncbi:MAG: antibiotic biosynthesis monooxygenase [Planctomycetes bacterium]|jgi:quinol monooxygenase YgiN|nr:antibiotic biosynthesis monooxygenase [Planctomycetota bacterium]MBT4029414.1 antibiotic biosynthesis monooxygenase [Planctomycetota bacterium]MBT4561240.1 antibiotic biosynthesis monooxygenase [Planctomycetota bacterium]MBT5102399.1 antibiotic biosynthesis monooxygenase [Planctomycetota bacterium]MBT5121015.1 antibiotic biosynthesis monooxygenase [Planctomycetota bacterium]